MAAENVGEASEDAAASLRFNEAAAHGRGKRPRRGAAGGVGARFNEAAAHGRGKPRAHVCPRQEANKLQ